MGNGRKEYDEDESSVPSDSSSLGRKFPIPQAFIQDPRSHRPHLTSMPPAPFSSRNNRPSQESRQRAKIQQLVKQAKAHQQATARVSNLRDVEMAQTMSTKLPAYHQQANEGKPVNSRILRSANRKAKFRGNKSQTSSAAAGSFAEALQADRNSKTVWIANGDYVPPSPTRRPRRADETTSLSTADETQQRRWYKSWMPRRWTTSRSTMIHV